VFLLFIFICLIVPFHHTHPISPVIHLSLFRLAKNRKIRKLSVSPAWWVLSSAGIETNWTPQAENAVFFCGPVWHLNRVICFGIIWLGEKGLRLVLSADILGRDKGQKFVVLKDSDIGFISLSLCELSFWWRVKEFAKIIRTEQNSLSVHLTVSM
jgi:hypothetical protein